jgi:hypothetical protein
VMYAGDKMSHDDFAELVDQQRRKDYYGHAA